MPWERHRPDPLGLQSDKQSLCLQIGAGAIAVAAIAVGAWVADRGTWWSLSALIAGAVLVIFGLYALLAVPLLGAPFPSARSEPVWRGPWSALPVSNQGRLRAREAKQRAIRERILNRLAGEAMRSGLSAPRAAQSLFGATLGPGPRDYWIAPLGGGGYMLGFDASGNIVEVSGPGLDSPEVAARIPQFEAIIADAQSWPELAEFRR